MSDARPENRATAAPRPVQELTLTVVALVVLLAITAGGFGLTKIFLDRGQNQRVLHRVVELTQNHLHFNRMDAAEQLMLRSMSMGHEIQQQEAWTFIEYVPVMPRFSRALIASLSERAGDPEGRMLLADLRYRREGAAAAWDVFDSVTELSPEEVVYANICAIEIPGPPVFHKVADDSPLFEGIPEGAIVRGLSRLAPAAAEATPYTSGVRALYRGDLEAAEGALQRAWSESRHWSDAAYLLGRIAEARNTPEDAMAWYAKALKEDTPHQSAARAYLRLAS